MRVVVLLSLVIAGCKTGPAEFPSDDTDETPAGERPILVIGAGVAGLSVARSLAANGKDVVVLEARDRLGGRVWTKDVGGHPTDLGAAWVRGRDESNPLVAFCTATGTLFGMDDSRDNAIWDEGFGFLERRDALPIIAGAISIARQADDLKAELPADASMEDAVTQWLDNVGAVDDIRRRNKFVATWWIEDAYAGPAEEQGLASFGLDLEFPGGDAAPQFGFGPCVDKLAEGLDVRLSQEVTRIAHDADGVTVTTRTGTFEGTDVVVTVPLGVLKEGDITFDPPLSSARQDAIGRLDMGAYEKVVLRFDDPFYVEDGAFIYHITRGPTAYPYCEDTGRYTGTPGLTFLSPAAAGERIASLSEDAAVDGAMVAVREMWSDVTIADPTASASTSWWEDPFARGSWSYLPIGATPADMDAVGGLEGTHVRFAGEHTDSRFYGTLHGAMITGLREASAILGTELTAVPVALP
jgi:monoamine oxidase